MNSKAKLPKNHVSAKLCFALYHGIPVLLE